MKFITLQKEQSRQETKPIATYSSFTKPKIKQHESKTSEGKSAGSENFGEVSVTSETIAIKEREDSEQPPSAATTGKTGKGKKVRFKENVAEECSPCDVQVAEESSPNDSQDNGTSIIRRKKASSRKSRPPVHDDSLDTLDQVFTMKKVNVKIGTSYSKPNC